MSEKWAVVEYVCRFSVADPLAVDMLKLWQQQEVRFIHVYCFCGHTNDMFPKSFQQSVHQSFPPVADVQDGYVLTVFEDKISSMTDADRTIKMTVRQDSAV